MDSQQKEAIDIAVAGHNLLILGTAGTGKSHTIKKIKDRLDAEGKRVKITCSTGIACSVFDDACTVHRFLGLNDGRFGADEINIIHSKNACYNFVEHNLNRTDCLIVDECSMISKRTFEIIHSVCLRKKAPIQLIFCGDFFQLPPVPNERYMDFGEYCFESALFSNTFPHKVVLCEAYRAREPLLIKAINDVFSGSLTAETKEFIQSLKRPLPLGQESIKLFSNNHLVDDYNRNCLLRFPGEIIEYVSKDSGEKSVLEKMTAPHTMWLKIGCPVILLQNLSDRLVNGLRGTIQNTTSDGIVVAFPSMKVTTKIPIVKFTVFNPSVGADIAVREQYPLRLAFALTIHKAQGMTLDSVEIDCQDIFKAGQLGVALSRATASCGLRVINFHPRYVMKPQKTVTDFLKSPTTNTADDFSCCRTRVIGACSSRDPMVQEEAVASSSMEEYSAPDPEDSAGQVADAEEMFAIDDDFDHVIKTIVTSEENLKEMKIPQGLLDEINNKIFTEKEITSFQKNMNEIVSRMNILNLMLFVKKLLLKMNEFIKLVSDKDEPITKGIPEKKMNEFYNHVHEYSVGPEYKLNCMLLFENEQNITDEHMVVCYKVLENVRLYCLKQKVDLIQTANLKVSQRFVTDTSKARIRYVAGYCVAKLRNKYTTHQKSNMYSKSKEGQTSYLNSKSKLSILNLLKEDEQFLMENSSQPESLLDTAEKQGRKRGLTNVTDSFYSFFLELANNSLKLVVNENLMKFGKDLFAQSLETLNNDKKLFEMFSNLVERKIALDRVEEFDETTNSDSTCCMPDVKIIFRELTEKYLSVLLAQFRRDVKSACKIEKKMAHRKQIKVSSKSEVSGGSIPKKSKPCGRSKKKSALSETDEPSASSGPDGPQPEAQATSSKTNEPSTSATDTEMCIPQDEDSSASQVLETNADDSDKCQKCLMDTDDEFIQCDSCDLWYHRKCAGLKNICLWKKFMKSNAQWFCKQCS